MDGDCLTGILGLVFFACLGSILLGLAVIVLSAAFTVGGIYGGCVGLGRSVHTYFSAFNQKCR